MKKQKKAWQGVGNLVQRNGDKKKRIRKNTTKYCWSHGRCVHDSVDYSWEKACHQNDANVVEKKGRSTEWCN